MRFFKSLFDSIYFKFILKRSFNHSTITIACSTFTTKTNAFSKILHLPNRYINFSSISSAKSYEKVPIITANFNL